MEKRFDRLLLSFTLVEEADLIFDMYEEAINNIPHEHWKTGDIDYLIPARLVLHATEVADNYTPDNPTGYLWEKKFNYEPDLDKVPNEELPSKEVMYDYHTEVRKKIKEWLRSLTIDDLVKSEETFTWTGSTQLGRIIYLLGHHRQHFGELNAELRRRGLSRIKWTTIKP